MITPNSFLIGWRYLRKNLLACSCFADFHMLPHRDVVAVLNGCSR